MHKICLSGFDTDQAEQLFGSKPPSNSPYPPPDEVTYKAIVPGVEKAVIKQQNFVCFSGITYTSYPVNKWRVEIQIPTKDEVATALEAFQFFQHLTEYDYTPEGVEIEEKPEHYTIFVPEHDGSSHISYLALCAARWCRTHVGLVRDYLRMIKEDDRLTPYQVLPLLSERWVTNDNHSPFGGRHKASMPRWGTSNPFLYLAAADIGQRPETFIDEQDKHDKYARAQLIPQIRSRANEGMSNYQKEFGDEICLVKNYNILAPKFSYFFQGLHGKNRFEVRKKFSDFINLLAVPRQKSEG